MYTLDFATFARLAEKGKRIPLGLETSLEPQDNVVTIVEKLGLLGKPLVLLESGKGTESSARYSFIGFEPWQVYRSFGRTVEIKNYLAGKTTEVTADPYEQFRTEMNNLSMVRYEGLPPFVGGAMGYFSYDMGRYFEKMPVLAKDDLALPESYFLFTDKVICLDHKESKVKIFICAYIEKSEENYLFDLYGRVLDQLHLLAEAIRKNKSGRRITAEDLNCRGKIEPVCNVTQEHFEEMVRKAKEYIRAGDIFQVNLSLRLGHASKVEPFTLYKVLREVNPSPYMSFLDFGDMHIVSSSPELLIRIRDGWAETRPIAGTRRRGVNREEDLALARELVNNEKERAEHIMLVDLERNDLGRVCSYGTVEVNELMVIEEYSHVMHIVSNVRGHLAPGKDRFDLFKAVFPGGTITGAPKIRSMEIIEELEPTRRGPYTGSIGYFGYAGEMEMNIVIRTLVVKEGMAYVQAGAGIVDDSVPEREYFESCKKAEALLKTLEIAEALGESRPAGEAEASA
ncbi:anthranilate synthase [Thermincola ferriacetica]|uniref:Anthranilate synthase n=1 Tax=Thermincola ferriacetica TaxID=281456 RepID=A0A0L6W2N9_9FIRM|nr:anthranilate synthase component I family protein [Thermincola ferriacetica]KNZ69736.1 anthranilate synthase [Thermincola ferriacetica]